MTVLTRGALHQRVWDTPIIKLAAELGVTNYLITEACRRDEIPTPPAGYWTRVQFGAQPAVEPLSGDPDKPIEITRGRRAGFPTPSPGRSANKDVAVIDSSPHPRLKRTIAGLQRRATPTKMGVTNGKGCFRVVVSAGSIPRVTSILSALLTGAEARGWAVVTAGKGLGLSPEGEDIGFELVELTDRQPHSITPAEAAAQAKWESRVQAAKRSGAYISTWDAPRIPEWDYTPNGKLSFKLDQHVIHRDIRRTFSDRKSQTVEDLAPSILEALEAHARAEQAFRLEQEQRRIESEERERLWALERKRQELELRRIEFLDRQLERCSRIQRTEALLAALGDGEMPAEAIRFADWARGHLASLQAELEPSAIAAKLAITGLMNEEAHVPQWIDVETGQYSPSR